MIRWPHHRRCARTGPGLFTLLLGSDGASPHSPLSPSAPSRPHWAEQLSRMAAFYGHANAFPLQSCPAGSRASGPHWAE